jgi:hypothetical protein
MVCGNGYWESGISNQRCYLARTIRTLRVGSEISLDGMGYYSHFVAHYTRENLGGQTETMVQGQACGTNFLTATNTTFFPSSRK